MFFPEVRCLPPALFDLSWSHRDGESQNVQALRATWSNLYLSQSRKEAAFGGRLSVPFSSFLSRPVSSAQTPSFKLLSAAILLKMASK